MAEKDINISIDINDLNVIEAKRLIKDLKKKIYDHDVNYYLNNEIKISDASYDLLKNFLLKIEDKFPELQKKDSPTQKVGVSVSSNFEKVAHNTPMLSLLNAFSRLDIENFVSRVKSFLKIDYVPQICVEPKVDGISFSALYKKGQLVLGATRGDGLIGEDVTKNICTIKNFPLSIENVPDVFEVRGEIYVSKKDFAEFKKSNLGQNFSNARNMASGSLRQMESNKAASRPLSYCVYAMLSDEKICSTQSNSIRFLSKRGFMTFSNYLISDKIQDIQDFYQKQFDNRENFAFEVDGLVCKVDDFLLQKRLGNISKAPRFAIAYKFPAVVAKAKIQSITFQVGRTGSITPVANLLPVNLSGVTISRASLHNFLEIEKKDIRIGDTVFLKRAGDVIPYISNVDFDHRDDKNCKKIVIPTECPSCDASVLFDEANVVLRCHNIKCYSQVYQHILHFVSKDALNIVGMGKEQVKKLIKHKYINNIVDIFSLKNISKDLIKLDKWGSKLVNNLLINIENAKSISLNRFIYSLGIRYVGVVNANIIAKELVSIKKLVDLVEHNNIYESQILQNLISVDQIGKKVIDSIILFIKNYDNKRILKSLIDILDIKDYLVTNHKKSAFLGKKVVFTGKLKDFSRTEAKEIAQKLGMKIVSNISNNVDMLICGDKKANAKVKRAELLNIKIILEKDWKDIIKLHLS